jgi:PilZ domain
VSESDPEAAERRRSPRFNCRGRAAIYCLPFDGRSIPAKLRNLSVGGICLDLAQPVEAGARAEVLVQVNAASFRAAALVKGQRERSATCLQFVQISAGGRDVLADVIARLARLQALNRKLRADRMDADTERELAEQAGFRLVRAGGVGMPSLGAGDGMGRESALVAVEPECVEGEIAGTRMTLIDIDLFV